eukprot:g27082.t1
MGQASCSEVFKAEARVPTNPIKEAVPALQSELKGDPIQSDECKVAPSVAEIQRLRDELQAKERALQLLRKDAIDQQYLLQLLERETFLKAEALRELRAWWDLDQEFNYVESLALVTIVFLELLFDGAWHVLSRPASKSYYYGRLHEDAFDKAESGVVVQTVSHAQLYKDHEICSIRKPT